MNPIITDRVKDLLNDILKCSSSVPIHIREQAIALHSVFSGVHVDFDKFSAFHDVAPYVKPEEYRELQMLILIHRKIEAIKMLRTLANTAQQQELNDLKRAKEAVEDGRYFTLPDILKKD
jgi:Asp-tRNA(Asn)/Glu-tRNA(Gln) amidotransferase B subunit